MKIDELEHYIEKRLGIGLTVQKGWDQVNNVVLKGHQAQFLFIGEGFKVKARFKQVYSEEVSSSPPQLQLRAFLLEKLGARLQIINQ